MPEVSRDASLVRKQNEYQNALLESADQFPRSQATFNDLFEHAPKLQQLLPFLANAQKNARIAYEQMRGTIDLKKMQQPRFAVSSCCDGEGNCIHGVGNTGDNVNAALVLRTPDSSIRYGIDPLNHKEVLTYAAAALYDLARAKGIDQIIHMRTSGSVFMEVLYYCYKHGIETYKEKFLADNERMLKFVNDPSIQNFIENGRELYETVLNKGMDYYEELMIVDDQDREKAREIITYTKNEGGQRYIDLRLIRCMEIQNLLDDREVIIKRGFAPENVIIIYQGQFTGDEYVFNPKLNRFILIPNLDGDSPHYPEARKRFLSFLPPQRMWRDVAEFLLQGARNYRHFTAFQKAQKIKNSRLPNPYVVCCSDSRALPKFVIDTGANDLRTVLRNPGAFISREDQLMTDARRFLALANLDGETVIISPHGNCGAQEAIDNFFEGDENVPDAFKDLAKHRIDMMRCVLNKGEAPPPSVTIDELRKRNNKNEILKFYQQKSGIPIISLGDCMAVQQLLWDIRIIGREFPELPLVAVFQNMTECQNYVYNSQSQLFVSIPELQLAGAAPAEKTFDRLHQCA